MAVSAEVYAGSAPVLPEGLSPEEVARRGAILKRFRELLKAQRDRFRDYLEVLDKHQDVIEQGNTDTLIAHVELEEKIVADIFAIQKVVDPLEAIYRTAYPEKYEPAVLQAPENGEPGSGVKSLKSALEELKAEALVRAERNRMLLANRMNEIRTEIKNLKKNPYANQGRSVYGETGSPSLIDIQQ
jgi:hypothetical protein